MKNRKKSGVDDAEFGIDSRYKTKKEQESESFQLMEARLDRMKNLSKEQILRAKLLQLKLIMEDYLQKPYNNEYHFSQFLANYIDTIYSKRIDFARDINVSPNFLSKIINNHRAPKEEFILKLMIHSEKAFRNVGEFHEKTWYEIYYHEKFCELMQNQKKWRPEMEKKIKLSESV